MILQIFVPTWHPLGTVGPKVWRTVWSTQTRIQTTYMNRLTLFHVI